MENPYIERAVARMSADDAVDVPPVSVALGFGVRGLI